MSRAIAAISGSAAALLPRHFVFVSHTLAGIWHDLTRSAVHPYRPEQHYMRGPGPAWHAKHGQFPSA